jgi:hypothetical protein
MAKNRPTVFLSRRPYTSKNSTYAKVFSEVKPHVYSEMEQILNLPYRPEVIVDMGNSLFVHRWKETFRGLCGVYAYVQKDSFKTYIGGSKDLCKRPMAH